jgi:hypothetical protein
MARSRSLFDDLDTAIATATLLTDDAKQGGASDAPLVSFSQSAPDAEKLPTTMAVLGLTGVAPPLGEAESPPHAYIQSAPTMAPPPGTLPPKRPASTRRPPSQKLLSQTKPSAAHDTAPHQVVQVPIEEPSMAAVSPTPPTPLSPTTGQAPTMPPATPAPATTASAVSAPSAVRAAVAASSVSPVASTVSPSDVPPQVSGSDEASADRRLPPKLPELTGITSPVVRCERIVSWIAEATGATDVFLADASGYPLAGATSGVDAKLAGTGLVTASIASLAASIPGNVSSLFELHLGDGPFFQLIGFHAGASVYVVGFTRSSPLTPRQSHAIRLACRHALGDTLKGGLWESE